MMQVLASILFFIVFIEAFIALSLYLGKTLYDFLRVVRNKQKEEHNRQI